MKHFIDKIIISLLCMIMVGCDNYERTGVEAVIYVNQTNLKLFVGEDTQLVANPDDGSVYTWESDNEEVATVVNGLVKAVGEGTTTIVVRRGEISTNVPVTVAVKIPTTEIRLSSESVALFPNTSVIITASFLPSNANDIDRTDFNWWSENESVASVNSVGEIKAIGNGSTRVFYRKGNFQKIVTVDVAQSLPFKGPHILSQDAILTFPMRDFDLGGEGNAYHDSDTDNWGGNNYRRDNGDENSPGVDIEGFGNIGAIQTDEWFLYTVDVKDAGTYGVQISSATTNEGGLLYLEIDGVRTDDLQMPCSGSWGTWVFGPEKQITLSEGKHTIKVFFNRPTYNVNEIKFEFLR